MKSKLNFIVIFLIAGYVIISNLFQSENNNASDPINSGKHPVLTYGERGIDNSWPSLENQTVSVADNITAKNYYLVVDGSGSMAEVECSAGRRKIDVAKEAVSKFVSNLPLDANLGLYVFDANIDQERISIASNNRNAVLSSIAQIDAGGGTPLANSISSGMYSLADQARKQLGYGEYHLVVVTDGHASSRSKTERQVEILLTDTPIILHTIGFCIGQNHSLNNPGRTVYKPADSPEALEAGLQDVLAEAPDFDASTYSDIN